ncbi:MAG: L-fucose/L-arabinose isomerase family protein [Anaerolineae bacterium]
MDKKAKVGLLGLTLEAYDRSFPQLRPYAESFARELAASMGDFAEIDFPGICNTRELVDAAVARFEGQGADLVMVVLLTYAPSLIALPALKRTRLPLLVLNTQRAKSVPQDASGALLIENHGMHGVQDLCNVLLRANRPFNLVTGHWQAPELREELRSWCAAARAVSALRHCRIGLLGYPMQDMGDFAVDEAALLDQLGVQVRRVPFAAVATRAQQAPADAIAAMMAEDRRAFQIDPALTEEEHQVSLRLEWALRSIAQEGGLNGLAIHFMAVDEDARLQTLPFLATSKMLGDGYAYGGEGDVTSAVAVYLMRELAGEANFTEMFTMDFDEGSIVMAHMGEGNWRMARKDRPVRLMRNPFSMVSLPYAPASLSFALEPGEVTLVSLTTGPQGRLRFVIAEGDVLDFLPLEGALNPQYKFAPIGDLEEFLTEFSLAGGSHHQALAYGSHGDTLCKVADLLGIDSFVI